MKPTTTLILISTLALGLAACSGSDDEDRQTQEQAGKKGVFTPYAEAHDEATQAADALNQAMQRNEERINERD